MLQNGEGTGNAGYGSREVWTPLSPLRNYWSRFSKEGRLKCLCKFRLLQVLHFNPGYQDDNDDNNNCDDNINDNNNDIDVWAEDKDDDIRAMIMTMSASMTLWI